LLFVTGRNVSFLQVKKLEFKPKLQRMFFWKNIGKNIIPIVFLPDSQLLTNILFLNLTSLETHLTENILPSSPIKILGKSVQGFMSYDRTYKQTNITTETTTLLFYSILFYSILFYSILFYSTRLRAHLLFQLWTFSLCILCKTKKKVRGFFKKDFVDF